MSNMPHCRFRNTLADLRDCQDALNEVNDIDDIEDEDERKAAWSLVRLCGQIGKDWGIE